MAVTTFKPEFMTFKPGDRVRILKDRPYHADIEAGEIRTVTKILAFSPGFGDNLQLDDGYGVLEYETRAGVLVKVIEQVWDDLPSEGNS